MSSSKMFLKTAVFMDREYAGDDTRTFIAYLFLRFLFRGHRNPLP